MRMLDGVLLTLLFATPALASSLEPSRADIVRAAQSCTAEGGFGHSFGEKLKSGESRWAYAPFGEEAELLGDRVYRIEVVASFAKAQMSQDDRIAVAKWVFQAVDAEVAKRGFAIRDESKNGITYYSQADRTHGYWLGLWQSGVKVGIVCYSIDVYRATENF